MRDAKSPPAWAERLLLAVVPADRAESFSGDLLEAYRDEHEPARGRAGADRWYLRQVARAFVQATWMWTLPLVTLFVLADVSNAWRLPMYRGWAVPFGAVAMVAAAALRGGWRTGRVGGGVVSGAGTAATLWLVMAIWWMISWYPFAVVQQAQPYWIDAWHGSAAPGETYLHWIFWDNVGAVVMSGLVLNATGLGLGLTGGVASKAARRVVRRP